MKIDRALLSASRQSWLDSGAPRVGPYWLQWLWTLLFCALLALGFALLGGLTYQRSALHSAAAALDLYLRNLIVCVTIGATIHLVFDLLAWAMGGLQRVRRWHPLPRTLFFSGIPLLCVVVSWPLGITLAGGEVLSWLDTERGRSAILGSLALAVVITFLFHQFFASRARQIEAERQATESRLRLLQGQIEPHFLFNTLAGVISLIEHDPARARQMLQDFTEYLRSSLGALRTGDAPLEQELALAEHYLRLMAVRMDGRLAWRVEADAAARRVRVPPLLLQPLVENAVQHGLEPQLQGGTVALSAHLHAGRLVLEVVDDGRGPDSPPPAGRRPGSGLGLANVRSRLQSRYAGRASLSLQPAAPGTRATLSLPVDAHAIDEDTP